MKTFMQKTFLLENFDYETSLTKLESELKSHVLLKTIFFDFKRKLLSLDYFTDGEDIILILEKYANSIKEITFTKKDIYLRGLDCAHCAGKIEDEVKNIDFIKAATLNFAAQKINVEILEGSSEVDTLNYVNKIVKDIEPHVIVSYEKEVTDNDEHSHEHGASGKLATAAIIVGALIFIALLIINLDSNIKTSLYIISYLLVGGSILLSAVRNTIKGQIFDENFLMSVATLGAVSIQEYSEAVAVMLFYRVGEYFQNRAVNNARASISALMDIRPDYANLKIDDKIEVISPDYVKKGDLIIIKPGEKIPLDGIIVEGSSSIDNAALTGESLLKDVGKGDELLSGGINKTGLLTVEVTKEFGDSTVAKILDLVENAGNKKAQTENFITKFSRYYTPFVVFIAVLIYLIPPLVIENAVREEWLYRALVFLVVSCPCALVISVPLSFFAGIGKASKSGILVKGSNFLEALTDVETVILDKTGTLTKGVFKVEKVTAFNGFSEDDVLKYAAFAEAFSTHPIARSVLNAYKKEINKDALLNYTEISGKGTKVTIDDKTIFAGNAKLMEDENISFTPSEAIGTTIYIAINQTHVGTLDIFDEIKPDSKDTIDKLKKLGIKNIVMLTGDNKNIAHKVSDYLGITQTFGELLPQDKVKILEQFTEKKTGKIIFVGDGINDAPSLAGADIGIAMGGVGSDAAIEAADVVIMTDEPSKIPTIINIAKKTRQIVKQNIIFALGVKSIILVLGAFGIATMWEAVFGDVGVTLIAVLNAVRILR